MPIYYFDALPLHPQPEHLESFTSYLSRLSENNGIDSISALASLCFPDYTLASMRGFKDYFPASFGKLPLVAVCSEENLLRTTFYYLAEKFGRSFLPPPSSNFLSSNIGENLRYCPKCLKDRLYYILPWRFTVLKGCYEHGCRLLDKCGYCSQPIPIFPHTLRVGICPRCKGDLRLCQTEKLSDEERQKVHHFSQDLESLLLPQTLETMAGMSATSIGQEFVLLRRARSLTRIKASNQSGIPNFILKSIENEPPGTANASFQYYLKYAEFLGVRVSDVLNNLARSHILLPTEDGILQQVVEAAKNLRLHNELITQRTICKLANISQRSLSKSSKVKRQLAEEVRKSREEQKRLRATKIFERVQDAIMHLEASGEKVTYHAISEITQIPSSTFKKYVEVRNLLKQKVSHKHRSIQEDKLLAQVQYAVQQLEKRQLTVTQMAVSEIVKVNRETLVSYPRVKAFLDMKAGQTRSLPSSIRKSYLHEEALLNKLKDCLPEIEELRGRVTLRAVGKILEVNPYKLKEYPRVWAILQQHLHLLSSQKDLREDAALLANVKVAIQQLEDLNLPVTYASISRLLGTYPSKFRKYPQTKAMLEQYVSQGHRYRVIQNHAREKELIAQIEQAIEHLNSLHHPITLRSVSTFIGVSLNCLRTYPQAFTILKGGVEAQQESTKAGVLQLEELIARIEEAKTMLRARGEPVTRQSISIMMGMNLTILLRYPFIREMLKSSKLRREGLSLRAEEAIRRLRSSGQVVTLAKLGRELSMSPSCLCSHSEIKSLLMTNEEDKLRDKAERFARRENELVLMVSATVTRLQLLGKPISGKAVARAIGMSGTGLKYYPKVKKVLDNAIENQDNKQRY